MGSSDVDQNSVAFRRDLISLIPHLRAFARSLCGCPAEADDLAQEAITKALKHQSSFELGTNMKAWLITIVRNEFYSEKRRSWRRAPLDMETAEVRLVAADNPEATLALDDLRQAMRALPAPQREALTLVGAAGLAYEEAAEICGCAIGTVKSRVSRARTTLVQLLESGAYERDGAPASEAMRKILELVPQPPGRSAEERAEEACAAI